MRIFCTGEIARVPLHVRDDFLLDDRGRHGPGRVEVDRGDVRGNFRRGMVRISDDRDVAVGDLAVLNRLDRGRRQVDYHIAVAELEVRPGQTVGRRSQLLEPDLGGDVDRLQRCAGHHAGLLQPHARLEALDCGGQPGVPGLASRRGRRRDHPRSPDACAASRPAGPCRRGGVRRCRSASRRRRRSRRSARTPSRWRRKCSAGAPAPGRWTARSRAEAEAARPSSALAANCSGGGGGGSGAWRRAGCRRRRHGGRGGGRRRRRRLRRHEGRRRRAGKPERAASTLRAQRQRPAKGSPASWTPALTAKRSARRREWTKPAPRPTPMAQTLLTLAATASSGVQATAPASKKRILTPPMQALIERAPDGGAPPSRDLPVDGY